MQWTEWSCWNEHSYKQTVRNEAGESRVLSNVLEADKAMLKIV